MPGSRRVLPEDLTPHAGEVKEGFGGVFRDFAVGADNSQGELPAAILALDASEVLRLSGPGIRVFLRISQAWGLSPKEQCQMLGGLDSAALTQWERDQDGLLGLDQIERISYVLGIYHDLHILLPASADGWVQRPNSNPLFQGAPAIVLITRGGKEGLRAVRNHLAAQVQGSWA